ncbi:TPA: hypothetical protein ACMDSS_004462 [Vibrio parahaemolyticus]|nr:hypothetical protein [Vibrio parahaemolyticus]
MTGTAKSCSQSCLWDNEHGSTDHRYYIESDLLANCIGYGHAAGAEKPGQIAGFSWSKHSLGYVLLGYLAERALGFRRLPFCMDRIEHWAISQQETQCSSFLDEFSEEKILEAVEELNKVYAHTQRKLKEANIDMICLTRQIQRSDASNRSKGYAESLMRIKDAAEIVGLDEVEFEMDTLNSYSSFGSYEHWADVTIKHEVSAKDILYCEALIGRQGVTSFAESGEWVAINRSPTGIVKLPVSAISYDKNRWYDTIPITTESEAERVLSQIKVPLRSRISYQNGYGSHGKIPNWKRKLVEYLLRKR